MKRETLAKGMVLLSKAFPSNQFDAEFFWQMLNDLADMDFEKAVMTIVRELREIYPGTNLIATLRDFALNNKKIRMEKTPKIMELRSDPPPPEWKELIKSAIPKVNQDA